MSGWYARELDSSSQFTVLSSQRNQLAGHCRFGKTHSYHFVRDERNGDVGFAFDVRSCAGSRLVAPLADGLEGGFGEYAVSGQDPDAADFAIVFHHGLQRDF